MLLLVIASTAGLSVAYHKSYQHGQDVESGRQLSLSQPLPLPELSAIDSFGNEVSLDLLRGHWSVLFFGYMHCPDVCTPTMRQLSLLLSSPPTLASSAPVQAVFVRIDGSGANDHESLAAYLDGFGPRVHGLNFMPPELASALGVWVQDREDGLYDHSTSLFVVSPLAQLHAVLSAPHSSADISDSLRKVDAYYVETS